MAASLGQANGRQGSNALSCTKESIRNVGKDTYRPGWTVDLELFFLVRSPKFDIKGEEPTVLLP